MKKRPKTLYITQSYSPYRATLFDHLNNIFGDSFAVLYYPKENKNLPWESNNLNHKHFILKTKKNKMFGKSFINYLATWGILSKFRPDVIVTGGFMLPVIISIVWLKLHGAKHVVTTDAWEHTEKRYSRIHIIIRCFVYRYITHAFMPVSEKGKRNFIRYGVNPKYIYIVPYTIDHKRFDPTIAGKQYDLLFCGQLIERKMPLFFCEVAKKINNKVGGLNILILGKGPLEKEVYQALSSSGVNFSMLGFIQPSEIPFFFQKGKLLLFPTLSDGWGVVANEACAAGVPVITCNYSGAANDLIIHKYNGLVLELNIDLWSESIISLLTQPNKLSNYQHNAVHHVKNYSIESAANNFISMLMHLQNS